MEHRLMIKDKIKRNLWVLPLLAFDLTYYFFIQLVTLPQETGAPKGLTIHWEAIFFIFLTSLFSIYCVFLTKRFVRSQASALFLRYMKILILSLLFFLTISSMFMIFTELILGQKRDLSYIIGNGLVLTFHHLIISSIYIGYLYLKESNQLKQKLIISEKAKAEIQLRTLQQQMSPHFMFNNLNTLMSLIEPSQKETLNFTKSLASIYRYFTNHMEEDLVSLSDEVKFIENYFILIEQRFGKAYELNINLNDLDPEEMLIVPMSLQLVIENAIKHNKGDRIHPLRIELDLSSDKVTASNEIREKTGTNANDGTGKGLQNLHERCLLIMKQDLSYQVIDDQFVVDIPITNRIQDESIDY